jgi:hypothetical protein
MSAAATDGWQGLLVGPSEEQTLRQLYRIADIDRDGRVGRRDAQLFCARFSAQLDGGGGTLALLWDFVDVDQSGYVDRAAFCVLLRALHLLVTRAVDMPSLTRRRVRATNIAWPATLTSLSGERRTEPAYFVHWPSVRTHFDAACVAGPLGRAVPGDSAALLLTRSRLPRPELARIWLLADRDRDRALCFEELALAVWLVTERLSNPFFELPAQLSDQLLIDVLDADTLDAANDDAALALLAPRYAWLGDPIVPAQLRRSAASDAAPPPPPPLASPTSAPPTPTPVPPPPATFASSASRGAAAAAAAGSDADDPHRAPNAVERARARELVEAIDGVPPSMALDGPAHRFIMQGKLSKLNPNGVWQARNYFLFDDVLIWTKSNLLGKRSTFKGAVSMIGGDVRQSPESESLDTRLCFTLRGGTAHVPGVEDKGKVYVLKSATPGEKLLWTGAMRPLTAPPHRRASVESAPATPAPAAVSSESSASNSVDGDDDDDSDDDDDDDGDGIGAAAAAAPVLEDSPSGRLSSSSRRVRPTSALVRERFEVNEGTFASAAHRAHLTDVVAPPLFVSAAMHNNDEIDDSSTTTTDQSPLVSSRAAGESLTPLSREAPPAVAGVPAFAVPSKPPPPAGAPPPHVVAAAAKQQSDATAASSRRRRRHGKVDESGEKKTKKKQRKKSNKASESTMTTPSTPASQVRDSPPPAVTPLDTEQDNAPPPPLPPDKTFVKALLRFSGQRIDVTAQTAVPSSQSALPAIAEDVTTSSSGSDDEADDADENGGGGDDDDDDESVAPDEVEQQDENAQALWAAMLAAEQERALEPAAALAAVADVAAAPHAPLDEQAVERALATPIAQPSLVIEAVSIDDWQRQMQEKVAAKRATAAPVAAVGADVKDKLASWDAQMKALADEKKRLAAQARATAAAAPAAAVSATKPKPPPQAPAGEAPKPPPPPPIENLVPPPPPPRTPEPVQFSAGDFAGARDAAQRRLQAGESTPAEARAAALVHAAARLMLTAERLHATAVAGKSAGAKAKAARKAIRLVELARSLVGSQSSSNTDAIFSVRTAPLRELAGEGEDEPVPARFCFETFDTIDDDEAYLECDHCASVFTSTSADERLGAGRACVACQRGHLSASGE